MTPKQNKMIREQDLGLSQQALANKLDKNVKTIKRREAVGGDTGKEADLAMAQLVWLAEQG